MDQDWRTKIRDVRTALGLTQQQLADGAGLSLSTVRGYERGHRQPRREHLLALLNVLNVDGAGRREILEGAGFASSRTLFPADEFPDYFFTAEELQHEVELVPWPEFVLNDHIEVIAANAMVQALWHVDFAAERARRSSPEMSLLSVASERRFADKMLNWDECVATMAAVFKGRPNNPGSLDQPDPYLYRVLEEFAEGDQAFLARLANVWAATPARKAKARWAYRVVWQEPEFGVMRFYGLVSTASEPDAYGFNDWIPMDAETWTVLDAIKAKSLRGRRR